MKKTLILLYTFLPVLLFGQGIDTLSQPSETDTLVLPAPQDTLIVPVSRDTLFLPLNADTTIVSDTAVVQDTLGLLDSARTSEVVDTLYPLHQRPLDNSSIFLSHRAITRTYSGFAEDYLKQSGRIFIRDYAFPGHPDEVFYYGTNSVSFTEDGLSLTRINKYYNVHQVQMGSVDSIEFIPAVKGFMYGQDFNSTSINFIKKDFLSQAPYSRIKYYEGPFGEAMLDGIFNSIFFNKLNVYADITNRSADRRYANTSLSSWQAEVKAKYIYSNRYNFIGSYSFNRTLNGLNGGVSTTDLYDELQAAVNFPTRELEDKQHLFRLRLLAAPVGKTRTDLSVYYRFSLTQIIPNDDQTSFIGYKSKSAGSFINQRFNFQALQIVLTGHYEHSDIQHDDREGPVFIAMKENTYSLSAQGTLNLFDSLLVPSVFFRNGNFDRFSTNNLHGAGADLNFYPLKNLGLYAGYSIIDNSITGTPSTLEAGVKYNSDLLSANGSIYRRNDYNSSYTPGYELLNFYRLVAPFREEIIFTGISGNASIRLWKFLLTSGVNYRLSSERSGSDLSYDVYGLPELSSRSGIYFDDIIFNGNLDLRTGFIFNYWGRQESNSTEFTVPAVYRLDFSLAGEIQKAAIIYFNWENVTSYNFYLTPYYPMLFSGIRFGVSWEIFN
jgi:hypothetical protein